MKMMFQFLKMSTGQRSEVFSGERNELAKKMLEMVPDDQREDNAVIVIMDDVTEEMNFSKAPIMTVNHFVELFGESNG